MWLRCFECNEKNLERWQNKAWKKKNWAKFLLYRVDVTRVSEYPFQLVSEGLRRGKCGLLISFTFISSYVYLSLLLLRPPTILNYSIFKWSLCKWQWLSPKTPFFICSGGSRPRGTNHWKQKKGQYYYQSPKRIQELAECQGQISWNLPLI